MPSYSQIRLNKTKELQEMLRFLKSQLRLLSETEILKLALSEFYRQRSLKSQAEWEEGLPTIELTSEGEAMVKESEEAYACGNYKVLDPHDDESWKQLKS
jgi:hypothetical protein